MKSIIRIAQIRVVPEKGKLDVNHENREKKGLDAEVKVVGKL